MRRCWILIGMMGAGKSTVGRSLAEVAGRPFVDTDLLLQQRLGRSIPQIFQVYGEAAFRDHESSLLRALDPDGAVISTGGGIVLRSENWAEMRRLGTVIYLEAAPHTLMERLENSKKKRPLLLVEDWQDRVLTLLEQRRTLYEQADLRICVDDMEQTNGAERVLKALREAGEC